MTMAWLVQKFNDTEITRWEIGDTPLVFGRAVDATVFIEDPGVSRQHCTVEKTEEGFILTDLESHNGTFVNGQRIRQTRLKNGDEILIGKYIFLFENPATINRSEFMVIKKEQRHDPALDAKAWYLTVTAKDFEQTTFLKKGDYLIGKGDQCDIGLTGWFVSPVHAALVKHGSDLYLLNVSDGNKPFDLNQKPCVKKTRLNPGDLFVIGGYELKVFTKDA
jgi:pSer/pThr/pTyr-binding forkhead associated (FHA) protein